MADDTSAAAKQRETSDHARGRPFAKGQSGNPKGRPKNGHTLADALRSELTPDRRAQVVQAIIERAVSGDVAAIKLLFERVDGRVPRPLELTGEGGGPVIVERRA